MPKSSWKCISGMEVDTLAHLFAFYKGEMLRRFWNGATLEVISYVYFG
jgi:hypothetical protein